MVVVIAHGGIPAMLFVKGTTVSTVVSDGALKMVSANAFASTPTGTRRQVPFTVKLLNTVPWAFDRQSHLLGCLAGECWNLGADARGLRTSWQINALCGSLSGSRGGARYHAIALLVSWKCADSTAQWPTYKTVGARLRATNTASFPFAFSPCSKVHDGIHGAANFIAFLSLALVRVTGRTCSDRMHFGFSCTNL